MSKSSCVSGDRVRWYTRVFITHTIRIEVGSFLGNFLTRKKFFCSFSDVTIEPVNITSSVPSSTGVGLQWVPPNTDKLGEHLSGYRVEIFDSLRGKRFNYTVNSSMTSADLNILKPFTRYEFKVFGFTSSWEGNITDIISVKTQEDGRLKAS